MYAFHVDGSPNGSLDDWKHFDWPQITTVSLYGRLSPALLCHAHAHNVRVVLGDGGTGTDFSETAVDNWITASVEKLRSTFADGLNIDLEISNCSVRKQHQALPTLRKSSLLLLTRARCRSTSATVTTLPAGRSPRWRISHAL